MPTQRPILIFADDLSGAAELAAVAAARELLTEVHREFNPASRADAIAIDTNSRSLSTEQAAAKIGSIAAHPAMKQYHIFKKTDSVLRGHVRAEIEALLGALNRRRAMLVPANPSRGRTIAAGQYLIDGIPLHETAFANDAEFPRVSASLDVLLGAAGHVLLHFGQQSAPLPVSGIIVPDANSPSDLTHFAAATDDSTLAAGAADFFAAMLDRWLGEPNPPSASVATPPITKPALLVCGSIAAWRTRQVQCQRANLPLVTPHYDFDDVQAAQQLRQRGILVIATLAEPVPTQQRLSLQDKLAQMASATIQSGRPATLLLEGGATAAAVVSELGWQHFSVQPAAAPGIGFLKPIGHPAAPLLLIKPGSYPWPPEIWQSFCASAAI